MFPISLVITVYNRERYLRQAIKSILKQTRGDFELIIWDDGSTDKSVEIAQTYARKDRRVKVIAATHLGRGKALAQAIDQTTGKYLGWVDSDDLLEPQALELTTKLLEENSELGMVYTNCLVINEAGEIKGVDKRAETLYSREKLLVQFMTFHFRLIRRSIYDLVGGVRSQFGMVEDYDLCLRLSEITLIKHLKKPLYRYRVHENNICATQQILQIQKTQAIIEEALERRGMKDKFKVEVRLKSQFKLKKIDLS